MKNPLYCSTGTFTGKVNGRNPRLALEAAPEEKIRGWYDFHKLGFYTAPMPEM